MEEKRNETVNTYLNANASRFQLRFLCILIIRRVVLASLTLPLSLSLFVALSFKRHRNYANQINLLLISLTHCSAAIRGGCAVGVSQTPSTKRKTFTAICMRNVSCNNIKTGRQSDRRLDGASK